MNLDYESDTRIDPEALDTEWLAQPSLMRRYTAHAAEMKKELDEAKERLEVGKAKIELEIRSMPERFGLTKVTEGAIQSTLILQDDYAALMKGFIDAKYEAEIALGAVRAMDQRKTALEELVRLFAASYFAGPRVPRDLSAEWAAKEGNRRSNTKVRMRRKDTQ